MILTHPTNTRNLPTATILILTLRRHPIEIPLPMAILIPHFRTFIHRSVTPVHARLIPTLTFDVSGTSVDDAIADLVAVVNEGEGYCAAEAGVEACTHFEAGESICCKEDWEEEGGGREMHF
ncbi:hypothetical protein TWF694_002460 [Orbilia ellipsospora]|uniref:Uncharacterized protein n=1 Tax=Orbilia ellipsospora TaxID=2528407 RepID=A0AAV9X210_9PEZI